MEANKSPNYYGLGELIWGFQGARWNVVLLANTYDGEFVGKQSRADYANTASDFDLLADTKPEWKELSGKFTDAAKRFGALLACTPYTAVDGDQDLGSSDADKYDWTDKEIERFRLELGAVADAAEKLMQGTKR